MEIAALQMNEDEMKTFDECSELPLTHIKSFWTILTSSTCVQETVKMLRFLLKFENCPGYILVICSVVSTKNA